MIEFIEALFFHTLDASKYLWFDVMDDVSIGISVSACPSDMMLKYFCTGTPRFHSQSLFGDDQQGHTHCWYHPLVLLVEYNLFPLLTLLDNSKRYILEVGFVS